MRSLMVWSLALFVFGTASFGQDKKSSRAASFERAINDTSFVFDVQSVASSASGGASNLGPDYSFKVTRDSVYSDLPYFGSSRFPNANFAQSPLKFISTHFTYSAQPAGKGWQVFIRFNDVHEVQAISFLISRSGYGNMQVTPLDLQSIAFSGTLEQPKL